MPLTNVIDRRKRKYRWKKINAVLEPARHDNRCKDSDRAKPNRKMDKAWIGYAEHEHISVRGAFTRALMHQDDVTLYLYDADDGIYEVRRARRGKPRSRT